MGKSQPAAPDPVATANAQAAANRNTAITQQQLNMMDQVNPWGTVTYDRTGTDFVEGTGVGTDAYHYNPATGEYVLAGSNALQDGWQAMHGSVTPKHTQTTTLTPEQQAIFDQTQAAQGNLAGLANDQSAAIRDLLNSEFTFTNDDAAQWSYDLASPRILEQQRQNEIAARNTLASKGIREGSPAFISEMQRLTNANSDQLNQLALTGRQQAFSEQLAQRNQPINEITALLSGSQVSNPAQMSGATPQTSVGGVDYSGLVQQNYQNQVSANNAKWGGIGGLFGSALSGGLF